jgi:SnoaL-like domain
MIEFRAAVESRDLARMEAALSPDVTFRSPVVFKAYEGREAVMHLLSTVIEVFEDFEYTDELEGDRTHALIFRARVGDREVEGIDHLTLDNDGLVTQLVVMVRPLSGLTALAQAMGERLGVPT